MPLYEYQCESCGRRTEILQRLDEPPATECPHCQGRLRKLLSAPAFQFKGSGWYLTDYARKGGAGEPGDAGKKGEAASSDGAKASSSGADGGKAGGEKSTGDASAASSTTKATPPKSSD